jgi:hypothetical protein
MSDVYKVFLGPSCRVVLAPETGNRNFLQQSNLLAVSTLHNYSS